MKILPNADDKRRARERKRGRTARGPHEIPVEGWKDIAWRVYGSTQESGLSLIAAGVTFYVILALFPALTALVSVYGLLANPSSIGEQVSALSGVLPDDAIGLVQGQLDSLARAPEGKLSLGFAVSLLAALWSVNTAMKSVFQGLNVTYGEKEKRGIVGLNMISFMFAMGGVLTMMVYLIAIAVVPLVLNYVGLSVVTEALIKLARWPILLVISGLMIALLNRFGPSRHAAQWKWVTPGSVFVMVAWGGGSSVFSFYLAHFANYDKTYGSLGAAIGLMVWVWVSTYILLVGAAINAEIEHQTAIDTTEDGGRPMGRRGAFMADTVGKAWGGK